MNDKELDWADKKALELIPETLFSFHPPPMRQRIAAALRSAREEERARAAEIAARAEIYTSLGAALGVEGFPLSREQEIINLRRSIAALIMSGSERAGDRDSPD